MRPLSSPRTRDTAAVCLVLFIIGAIYFHSCSRPDPVRLKLLTAVDTSGSRSDDEKRRALGLLEHALEEAVPGLPYLKLWTFGKSVDLVFDDPVPEASALWSVEDQRILNETPEDKREQKQTGTYPHLMLRAVVNEARAAQQRGELVAVLILADGEDKAPERSAELIREMATLPNVVAVWVAGPQDEGPYKLRTETDARFSPFGDRRRVSGPTDWEDDLEWFRERLTAAVKQR